MEGPGSSSESPGPKASVTIWNIVSSKFVPVKVSLKKKRTVFDSQSNTNVLHRFVAAFGHEGTCLPLKIAVDEKEDGSHVVQVLSDKAYCFVVLNGVEVHEDEAERGLKMVHGDRVKIYYEATDEEYFAGPFAFEYLREDQQEETNPSVEEPTPPLTVDQKVQNSPGSKKVQKMPINFIELPPEVIQLILSHVSADEVVFNVSQVCTFMNNVVKEGVQLSLFVLKKDTIYLPEERAVFERLMTKFPPKSAVLRHVWCMAAFGDSDQVVPTSAPEFVLEQVTKSVENLTLTVVHDVPGDPMKYPRHPHTDLSKFLPKFDQLKFLQLKGQFCLASQSFVLPNLEEIWMQGRYANVSVFFGSTAAEMFPKLSSVGIVTLGPSYHLPEGEMSPAYKRVQLRFVPSFNIIWNQVKTLKLRIKSLSHLECAKKFCKLTALENLSLFFPESSIDLVEVKWLLTCVPTTVKFLQLSMDQLTEEILKTIVEHFFDLECLFVSCRQKIPEELKSLKNETWKEVGFKVVEPAVAFLLNNLVDKSVRRSVDFWRKKVYDVFGPLDTFDPFELS